MLTIRELEIMKSALECDIGRQKSNMNGGHRVVKPEFVDWLADTEKLLKKVSLRLSKELSSDEGVEYLKNSYTNKKENE